MFILIFNILDIVSLILKMSKYHFAVKMNNFYQITLIEVFFQFYYKITLIGYSPFLVFNIIFQRQKKNRYLAFACDYVLFFFQYK